MKIKASIYDTNSIRNAIKQLRQAQKDLVKMYNEFLNTCCDWFIERANLYVSQTEIGGNAIAEIQQSWVVRKVGDSRIIENNARTAVFVEFGVGVVGGENPHDNASMAGYDYNIPTVYKNSADGSWVFYENQSDMNIPDKDIDNRVIFNEPNRNSERMLVKTRGTKAVMYAYNALIDLQMEMPKIWQKIKVKYWG